MRRSASASSSPDNISLMGFSSGQSSASSGRHPMLFPFGYRRAANRSTRSMSCSARVVTYFFAAAFFFGVAFFAAFFGATFFTGVTSSMLSYFFGALVGLVWNARIRS